MGRGTTNSYNMIAITDCSGAFFNEAIGNYGGYSSSGTSQKYRGGFAASNSSSIYSGDSVTPNSIRCAFYIKF